MEIDSAHPLGVVECRHDLACLYCPDNRLCVPATRSKKRIIFGQSDRIYKICMPLVSAYEPTAEDWSGKNLLSQKSRQFFVATVDDPVQALQVSRGLDPFLDQEVDRLSGGHRDPEFKEDIRAVLVRNLENAEFRFGNMSNKMCPLITRSSA